MPALPDRQGYLSMPTSPPPPADEPQPLDALRQAVAENARDEQPPVDDDHPF